MSALSDVLCALMRDARRIAVSPDAEVSTTSRAGVISVRVTDGGALLLSATLDTRQRVDAPRAEQLAFPDEVSTSSGKAAAVVVHQPSGELPRVTEVPAPQAYPLTPGAVILYGEEGLCRVDEVSADAVTLTTIDEAEELAPLWSEIEEVSPGVWRDRQPPGAKAEKPKRAAFAARLAAEVSRG